MLMIFLSNYNNIRKIKDQALKVLLARGLQVNNTKIEEYAIKKTAAGKILNYLVPC